MAIEKVVPKPVPESCRRLHTTERETTITEAQDAVLTLLERLRRAEHDPVEYSRFESWQRLQREVDWILDGEEPVQGSDPETVLTAQIVAAWMKRQ